MGIFILLLLAFFFFFHAGSRSNNRTKDLTHAEQECISNFYSFLILIYHNYWHHYFLVFPLLVLSIMLQADKLDKSQSFSAQSVSLCYGRLVLWFFFVVQRNCCH